MALNPNNGAYPGITDLSPASSLFAKYINPTTVTTYQTVKVQHGSYQTAAVDLGP